MTKLQKELDDARNEAANKEKYLEAAAAKLAPAVAATAVQAEGITLVPTVAGHILHSNDVSPEMLHNVAMSSSQLQGITSEQSKVFIEVILSTLKTQATEVAPMQQSNASGVNLQTQRPPQQDGRRGSEEEELWTDSDMDEDEKELAEVNRKEGGVAPPTKKRIKKSAKQGKTNAAAAAGATSKVITKTGP
jgi:hypothetical protein